MKPSRLNAIATLKRLALGCLLMLLSCYDEPASPWTFSLAEGTWKRVRWTSSPAYAYTFSDGSRGTFTDLFKLYAPCRRDDEYTFEMDPGSETRGSYTYQEGKLACGSETVMESCTWFCSELNNEILIYFELPGSKPRAYIIRKIYKLEQLTPDRLIFTYKVYPDYTWREEFIRLNP